MRPAPLALAALAALGLAGPAAAQTLFQVPLGGHAPALGDAGATEATAFAAFWNPAGLGALAGAEAGGSYLSGVGARGAYAATGALRLHPRVVAGLHGAYFAPGGLYLDQAGEEVDGPSEALAGATVAVGTAGASVGVTVRGVRLRALEGPYTGATFDVGGRLALLGGDLVVGVAAANLGPALRGDGADLPLDRTFRAGVAARVLTVREAPGGPPVVRARALVDLSRRALAVLDRDDLTTLHFGVEVEGFDLLAARAGYVAPFGGADEGRLTFGLAFRYDRVQADVALLPVTAGVDDGTRYSFGVRYGW